MTAYNHYFDRNNPLPVTIPPAATDSPVYPYLFSVAANPETSPPPGTLRGESPLEAAEGQWPGLQNGIIVFFENHKGEAGYVNGKPHTIKDYGPYPDGWSVTPPPPPPPTPEEQQAAVRQQSTDAIQERLNAFARTRNYDDIHTAASYDGDPDPVFALEGSYAKARRGATWRVAYGILNAVLAGERAMPSLEEVMAELPELAWPDEAAQPVPMDAAS